MSFTVNLKKMKTEQPEVYEKWKLAVLLVDGAEGKEEVPLYEFRNYIGADQLDEFMYDATEGFLGKKPS